MADTLTQALNALLGAACPRDDKAAARNLVELLGPGPYGDEDRLNQATNFMEKYGDVPELPLIVGALINLKEGNR